MMFERAMNVRELLSEISGKCNIIDDLYYNDKLTDEEEVIVEGWYELMRERFKGEL